MNRREFIWGGVTALGLAAGAGTWFVRQPQFGRSPSGIRMERIQASPNFVHGHFRCLEPVETSADKDENYVLSKVKFFLQDKSELFPKQPMISSKTDLRSIPLADDIAIWMGHSTFYLQLGGKRILIDPVFSEYASPVFFINKAFPGSNVYTADDFPEIDVLAVSHDHWDHLDYPSIMALKPKTREVVCPLGIGEYFEQWGFAAEKIHEEDWYSEIRLSDDFSVHILPSQHYSGRFTTPNNTEWCGFAFVTSKKRVFCSGDGGYGNHFKKIGRMFDGFDLAIMENGQYNEKWQAIHLLPQYTAQAATDVRARQVITSHNGKFALALHKWNQPYLDMEEASQGKNYEWLTPKIGETTYTGEKNQHFTHWWEQME